MHLVNLLNNSFYSHFRPLEIRSLGRNWGRKFRIRGQKCKKGRAKGRNRGGKILLSKISNPFQSKVYLTKVVELAKSIRGAPSATRADFSRISLGRSVSEIIPIKGLEDIYRQNRASERFSYEVQKSISGQALYEFLFVFQRFSKGQSYGYEVQSCLEHVIMSNYVIIQLKNNLLAVAPLENIPLV